MLQCVNCRPCRLNLSLRGLFYCGSSHLLFDWCLQVLTRYISWADTLLVRATCSHLPWPLVAATYLANEHTCTVLASAGATAAEEASGTAELTVISSTQQLSAALSKFINVRSVTLLLTPNTTGLDLQQALLTVDSKVGRCNLIGREGSVRQAGRK